MSQPGGPKPLRFRQPQRHRLRFLAGWGMLLGGGGLLSLAGVVRASCAAHGAPPVVQIVMGVLAVGGIIAVLVGIAWSCRPH